MALVYDVIDTEGAPVPEDVAAFSAHGEIDELRLKSFEAAIKKKNIDWLWMDSGDGRAGSISVVQRPPAEDGPTRYRMQINRNHTPAVQFVTIAHELAHLFLGHLGSDKHLRVSARHASGHSQQELEAESVAYIVCRRNGVNSKSHPYLSSFITENVEVDSLDVYQIMKAAGRVETVLGLRSDTL